MVRVGLVFAAVARVLVAELQQFRVELLQMVFVQREIGPAFKNPLHHPGVARHLLLVAGGERCLVQAGQQPFHLVIGQLDPLNARGGADALNRGAVPQRQQPLRGQRPQRLPLPLRLIELGDEVQHFRGDQRGLRHRYPLCIRFIQLGNRKRRRSFHTSRAGKQGTYPNEDH